MHHRLQLVLFPRLKRGGTPSLFKDQTLGPGSAKVGQPVSKLGVLETVPMSCSQCPNGYRLDRRAGTSNGCARSPDSPRGKTWETPGRPGLPAPGARVRGALHPHRRTLRKKSLGITSNPVYSEWERLRQPHGHRRSHRPGGHRTIILEFDVPSYHTDAAQQRGQEQKMNPRVRSIGIRPPPILRRPAVHPGARLSLRPAAGFIRPTACSLPDSFFPGREL